MFYIFSGIQIDDTGLILALPLKLKHNYILVQFLLLIQEFSEKLFTRSPLPTASSPGVRSHPWRRQAGFLVMMRLTDWATLPHPNMMRTIVPSSSATNSLPITTAFIFLLWKSWQTFETTSRKTKLKLLRKMFYERVPQNTITGFFAKQTITGLQYNFFGKQTIVWVHLCQQSWQPLSTVVSACWPNLQRNW